MNSAPVAHERTHTTERILTHDQLCVRETNSYCGKVHQLGQYQYQRNTRGGLARVSCLWMIPFLLQTLDEMANDATIERSRLPQRTSVTGTTNCPTGAETIIMNLNRYGHDLNPESGLVRPDISFGLFVKLLNRQPISWTCLIWGRTALLIGWTLTNNVIFSKCPWICFELDFHRLRSDFESPLDRIESVSTTWLTDVSLDRECHLWSKSICEPERLTGFNRIELLRVMRHRERRYFSSVKKWKSVCLDWSVRTTIRFKGITT
jgi:hypothetical protein